MLSIKILLKIGGFIMGILICSTIFAQTNYYYYGSEMLKR